MRNAAAATITKMTLRRRQIVKIYQTLPPFAPSASIAVHHYLNYPIEPSSPFVFDVCQSIAATALNRPQDHDDDALRPRPSLLPTAVVISQ